MFSRNKDKNTPASQSPQPAKPAPPSIISKDLQIVGDLESNGEIQVDGSVVGDIRTKNLLVGPTASVEGEIIADTVKIHGSINGQIKARSVTLAKSAHMVGDIMHEDLSIETGAFLEGLCKRIAMSETKDKTKTTDSKNADKKGQQDPQAKKTG